jgi:signal transduction histidine kinase
MQTLSSDPRSLPKFPKLGENNGAKLLVESSKLFSRTLDSQRIYEAFKHVVEHTIDCDAVLVSAYAEQTQMIRCAFAFVDGELLDPNVFPPVPFEITPGRGMQSEVIRTGEARLFGDVSERVAQGNGKFYTLDKEGSVVPIEKGQRPDTQFAIMVPVRLDEAIIGVAQVSKDRGEPYTEKDMVFVEGLAVQIAAALKNAELFQQMQDEIAERIRVEQMLREREAEVERLNQDLEARVKERTEELRKATADMEGFCYSVSHDLRTPLRGISGAAMMLMEDYGDRVNEEGKEHLKSMRLAAKRMSQLIDGLLSLSRLGRHQMHVTEVDFSALAERIVSSAKRSYHSDPDTTIQAGILIQADYEMIAVAMENLISNAVKFSSKAEAPKVEVGTFEQDGQTIYFVKDNGAGFEQEFVEKIFKPFERLHKDSDFPGTGIGLANVKRVIERHGGTIWAEGQPGKGATLFFTLGMAAS